MNSQAIQDKEEHNLNRMILELKMKITKNEYQQKHEEEEEEYDDEYLNAEIVANSKSRNSSTSDSGCSSSASFISNTDTTVSLSSSLNSSSRQSPIANGAIVTDLQTVTDIAVKKTRIISGVWGRAKNGDEQLMPNVVTVAAEVSDLVDSSFISTQTINYGDDCGFICNKRLTTKAELKTNEKHQYDDDGYDDGEEEKHLVAKYYFGLADGVSANRLRGYDAKLFPTALLNACTHFIDKLKDIHIHSSSPKTELHERKEEKIIFNSYKNDQKQEETEEDEELEGDWENDEDYEQEDRNETTEGQEQEQIEYEEDNDCVNLNRILMNAHNLVQQHKVYGSSTVCLLSLEFYNANKSYVGLLSSCNLGDSGYMLIRDYKVVFKSQSQSHRYNAPYQLGCTPPELLEHDLYRDKPEDSLCHSHHLKQGDYLIISSDGLFDNLYEDEIALIVQEHIASEESAKITSDLLESTCQLLVHKASKAGIKKDDILIMLIYID